MGGYELLWPDDSPGAWVGRVRDTDGFQRTVVVRPIDPADLVEGRLTPEASERLRLIMDRSHPALVALLDVCREGDSVFMVTEHVPGADLEAVAKAAPGGLSADVVASLGKEVCLALEVLHGRPGVRGGATALSHGAIDGRSIRLSRTGAVRVACPACALSTSDPDHPPDPSDDLFALGLALRPLVPPGTALASVMARATTVHPELRYQNAGAMRLALDQALRSLDPNLGPRERRRRSDALHSQLAALVALALDGREAQGERVGLIPMDRLDFAPGPGSLFIEVEQGEGPSEPAQGGQPVEPIRQRRDRRTLELVPSGELDRPQPQPAVPLEPAPGRPAGWHSTLEPHPAKGATPTHDTEETPALWGAIGDPDQSPAAPPGHVELSDLLVVDAIPRGPGEEPAPPEPAPPVLLPIPATREGYHSASRRVPLTESPHFRLLIVAVSVLLALLVCLGALLVDRGHRQALADALPDVSWDPENRPEAPGAVSPL